MRIGINLLQLDPGRPEGVATYVRELARRIGNLSVEGEQFFFIMQKGLEMPAQSCSNVYYVTLPDITFFGRAKRKLRRIMGLPLSSRFLDFAEGLRLDTIHYPFSTIPPEDSSFSGRIILSVMDIQHEYFPQFFSQEALNSRRSVFASSCDRADQIIAISKFTKTSVIDKFKVSPEKIEVIYLAGDISEKRTKIKVPKKFLYYPAADWRHKNHEALFKALASVIADGKDIQLVLSGTVTERMRIHNLIEAYGISKNVTALGQISYEQVAFVYSKALGLIFPSLFEGFGIPVVEAMCLGIPAACSNTTSLNEIAVDAALTFDPTNITEIKQAMITLWENNEVRERLKKAGSTKCGTFSWDKMTEETLSVYRFIHKEKNA
jgi:glycosyltransferase involved in cell wall biosynthesis